MGKKYKITLERNTCIGVFACVEADGKLWIKSDDGKVEGCEGSAAGGLGDNFGGGAIQPGS